MRSLVQLHHPVRGRRLTLVEQERLQLLRQFTTVYEAAQAAIARKTGLQAVAEADVSDETLDYEAIYAGRSEWKILPSCDHPEEPARCLITGTGLTHRKSADNRNVMHAAGTEGAAPLTDSMRMYEMGREGGRPASGTVGVQPEWFYKGCGTSVRAHNEPLDVPAYADDGGEEAEIAGVYLIGPSGQPYRLGFTIGNEFSDHVMERVNYLYLAPSKLRACALGPELVVGADFDDVRGNVRILRGESVVWTQELATGESHMTHTLANLEHHHFKYEAHRRPGDVHIHFFGAGAFSFGAGVRLEAGDVMEIAFEGYGRPLRNPLHIEQATKNVPTGVLVL